MGSGLKDALIGWWQPPPSSSATPLIIPGLDDDTEAIELLTPEEWKQLNREFYPELGKRPWWDPACECGSDKTYGPNNKLHAAYCPRFKR